MYLRYEDIRAVSVEMTSRCNAACPQCPRTTNPILPMSELTMDDIERIFTRDFCSQLDYVYMCGNFGDGMVSNTTLPAIKYFHRMGIPQVSFHTNGSGRSPDWWRDLAKAMTGENDHVVFGIDGLADTNHLYRRNTNWDVIMQSVNAFIEAGGKAVWQYLIFEHNQHQVDEARAFAEKLGFIRFTPLATSRFVVSELRLQDREQRQLAQIQTQNDRVNQEDCAETNASDTPLEQATVETQPAKTNGVMGAYQLQQQAETYLVQGNLQEALNTCQEAISLYPEFAGMYKTLGNVYRMAGKIAEAGDCYAKAIEIQPVFPEVYANLGSLYAQKQQWSNAILYYQKAISLKPNFSGAYRNLAKVWEHLGKKEEAQQAWYQAIAVELPFEGNSQTAVAQKAALAPPSLEEYQNPEKDNFVQVVESYGGLSNYYRNVEISCQTQVRREIFISFEAELWPCCWVSHTKYVIYNETYRPQILKLIEKYGKGFNDLRKKTIQEVIEGPWYREDLVDSWSSPNRLDVCAQECGKSFNSTCSQYI